MRCTSIAFRARVHCSVVFSTVFLANPVRRYIKMQVCPSAKGRLRSSRATLSLPCEGPERRQVYVIVFFSAFYKMKLCFRLELLRISATLESERVKEPRVTNVSS